jgi:hypothetical protein
VRIALVPGTRDWSYDYTARALAQHLPHDFEIFYSDTLDGFHPTDFDLAVDFWWRGTLNRRFGQRALKQVSSHRWSQRKYGSLDARSLIDGHLRQSGAVLVPSARLASDLADAPHVTLCPKGFHPETFGDEQCRAGDLTIGWAGDASAKDKRVDILLAACPDLRTVGPGTPSGKIDQERMPAFYNSLDVITCASTDEGDPRPLIEGMACGCFPVVVDVGIVPELVRHGDNGLIVERTPEAFAAAFDWCRRNVDYVRAVGHRNARRMLATRTWAAVAPTWGDAFAAALERAPEWKSNLREERRARVHTAMRKRLRARLLEAKQ